MPPQCPPANLFSASCPSQPKLLFLLPLSWNGLVTECQPALGWKGPEHAPHCSPATAGPPSPGPGCSSRATGAARAGHPQIHPVGRVAPGLLGTSLRLAPGAGALGGSCSPCQPSRVALGTSSQGIPLCWLSLPWAARRSRRLQGNSLMTQKTCVGAVGAA